MHILTASEPNISSVASGPTPASQSGSKAVRVDRALTNYTEELNAPGVYSLRLNFEYVNAPSGCIIRFELRSRLDVS